MSRLVVVSGLPGTALVSALVARVLPSGALVAAPVVACQARHQLLAVTLADGLDELPRPCPAQHRRCAAAVRDDDAAVATPRPLEVAGSSHGPIVHAGASCAPPDCGPTVGSVTTRARLWLAFALGLAATTILYAARLGPLEAVLSSRGHGIVSLELAFSRGRFERIIADWGAVGTAAAIDQTWWDFVWIPCYCLALFSAVRLAAAGPGRWVQGHWWPCRWPAPVTCSRMSPCCEPLHVGPSGLVVPVGSLLAATSSRSSSWPSSRSSGASSSVGATTWATDDGHCHGPCPSPLTKCDPSTLASGAMTAWQPSCRTQGR